MKQERGPESRPTSSPARPGGRRQAVRLAWLGAIGMVVIGAACAFRHYCLDRPEGSGPAGPGLDRSAFSRPWTDRRVVLLGVGDSVTAGYGASPSLSYFDRLVRNPPDEFADMRGLCLSEVLPGLKVRNIAVSGSTSLEHLEHLQRLEVQPAEVYGLVVVTTGGNDIIHDYGRSAPREGAMYGATLEQARPWISAFEQRLGRMFDLLRNRFPGGCHVFLADIYDPTDGVGSATSAGLPEWPDGLALLSAYNEVIRRICRERADATLVPAHREFLGHGIYFRQFWRPHYRADDPTHWYYVNFEDPNDRGYDALRRLFLKEIAAARGELR